MKTLTICSAVLLSVSAARYVGARELTFEDRVKAQESIERVYFSHELAATKTFSEAVPRPVLEAKVHKYLEQTALLTVQWKTAVTDKMLQRELQRMVEDTKMSERLNELFSALGNDPLVIKECLARATLVDRLIHDFYDSDVTLHMKQRAQAESIRERLVANAISPSAEIANRHVLEVVVGTNNPVASLDLQPWRREVSTKEFQTIRARLPVRTGEVSDVKESRSAFRISVILTETPYSLRVAEYEIRKTPWEAWWQNARRTVRGESVAAVASGGVGLPQRHAVRAISTSGGCDDDYWDNGSLNALPGGREAHTAVWTGTFMIVWGGDLGDTTWQGFFVDSGGRYDPATDTWMLTSTVGAPSRRFGHTAVWTGTAMLVWGGHVYLYSNLYASTNDGALYDPMTDTWTPSSDVGAPVARERHTALWTGSAMLVWGGINDDEGAITYLNDGAAYDPGTGTWTAIGVSGAPSGRADHTAIWTGARMIIWGGTGGGPVLATGAVYDPASGSWSPMSTASAPAGRSGHAAIWTGISMIVWGGTTSVRTNTGGRYDPASDSWTPTATANAPTARDRHTMVWTGTRMIVWGGRDNSGLVASGGRYNPTTDSWTATSALNAPAPRVGHSMVWTGSLAVVWGGFDDVHHDLKDTGGRYDPVTDSWTATSIMGAPSARTSHTAVWTGSVMVIWGGSDWDLGVQATGGKYDPALDHWSETSMAAAPAPRSGHTAVWTGVRMLVWGGWSGTDFLNTGAQYDPVADAWTAMSTSGAPAARLQHAAVWTGQQMIVWGGYDTVGGFAHEFNTGGRYDPATDSWLTMAVPSALQGRVLPTINWSGSVVIVWGGSDALQRAWFIDGGMYNPTANTWTSMASAPAGAPWQYTTAVWTGHDIITWGGSGYLGDHVGRFDPTTNAWTVPSAGGPWSSAEHSAVWTGNEMVVWGGSPVADGGGLFDATTNTWCPTTYDGVPSGRLGHTAVWTGNMMLVWGGQLNGASFGTGGRYFPHCRDNDGDGMSECQGDCNDANPGVHPGAAEVCNGIDDDCDGIVDNGGVALCNDNDVCTTDNCGGGLGCSHTFCDDSNPCTDDTCAAGVGCVFTNNTSPCTDGNACTVGDVCEGGTCLAGTGTRDCDDGNPCTNDTCVAATGCSHANNAALCDDQNRCTVADVCGGGQCHGSPIVCNDNNPCTDDSCNPATGVCVFANDDANACDDGNPCTQTDTCHAGSCSGSNPVQCNGGCPPGFTQVGGLCQRTYDIGVSLLDNLSTFCDGTGTNRYNNCGYSNYGLHWTDLGSGLAAVADVDVQLESGINCGGTSSGIKLNGVPVGSFSPVGSCQCTSIHGTISLSNLAAGGYVMAGVNAISITPSGNCEGLSKSVNLGNNFARVTVTYSPHSNACQVGTCDPIVGACNFSNRPDGTTCSDNNACTTGDTCVGGSCLAAGAIVCNDGNVCTNDSCDPMTGCVYTNNTNVCDDGNACTYGDTCSGASCIGAAVPAPSEASGVTVAKSGTDVTIAWTLATNATTSDVLRGDIALLPVGPGGDDEVCLGNTGATTMTDTYVPAAGSGVWYLIRGKNVCAGNGTFGNESNGAPRTTTTCP